MHFTRSVGIVCFIVPMLKVALVPFQIRMREGQPCSSEISQAAYLSIPVRYTMAVRENYLVKHVFAAV